MYDCNANVLLNVYSCLVFVCEGWLALVAYICHTCDNWLLKGCYKMRAEYVEELVAAVPELEIINCRGVNVRNKHN